MLKKLSNIACNVAGVLAAVGSFGQMPSNKPTGATQVNSASVNVATPPIAYPAGVKINYVRTREAIAPITDEATFNSAPYTSVKEATQYLDGLGRPLQTVIKQGSAGITPKDIVSPVVYDEFGREVLKYLPYVQINENTSDGSFKTNPFNAQSSFFTSSAYNPGLQAEQVYYSKNEFEASPLNRVTKTMAPGNSWAGSNRGTSMEYRINDVNDAVRIWYVTSTAISYDGNKNIPYTLNIPTTASVNGTYPGGVLYETETSDEHGKKVVEYKDKEGRVIIKKVQIDDNPGQAHVGWLCTYYVYDDFGQLRFVIPPKAVKKMNTDGWQLTEALINELCFRYEYDGRQRMITKKVPGAGWVYMVYDKRDRLSYTQDANMRTKNQWLATLYDELNRPRLTGMITYANNRDYLQLYTDNNFNPNSTGAAGVAVSTLRPADLNIDTREVGRLEYKASNSITFNPGFTSETGADFIAEIQPGGTTENIVVQNNPLPPGSNFIALTITYYDDYSHTSKTYNTADNGNIDDGGNPFKEALVANRSGMTKGMVTGTKVRVLEDASNLASGEWLETVMFYNDKGRVIQVKNDNYKHGSDVTTSLYDFSGKVLTTYAVHNNPAALKTIRVKTNILYDQGGRLVELKKTLNDDISTTRLLAKNEYDEMGQLKRKNLGLKPGTSDYLEKLDYSYNIRGWLQGINRDYARGTGTNWFGMELNYDWGFGNNQYNGNIAGTKWRSKGDGERRAYGYGYDAASRLLYGDFSQHNGGGYVDNSAINFDMMMGNGNSSNPNTYDENGNILQMQQWGLKVNTSLPIDNLSYGYYNNGNKLSNVTDLTGTTDNKLGDFTDKNSGDDYGYDVNGNMITDKNKGISGSTGPDVPSGGAIEYNHLNLPYLITVAGKGTIKYIYDATGNKIEKRTVEPAQSKNTRTNYLAGYIYENDKLQFFGHEEGRVRETVGANNTVTGYSFDYFIKDHLGNVRTVLTDEVQQNIYPAATLEGNIAVNGVPNAINIEKDYYTINTGNVVDKPAAMPSSINKNGGSSSLDAPVNNNPNSDVTANSQKVYQLEASSSGGVTGLGVTLKVMAGDRMDVHGKSYWQDNNASGNNYNVLLAEIIGGLLGTPGGATAGKGATVSLLTTGASPTILPSSFLSRTPPPGDQKPMAYINWILFDEQFKYVNGSFSRVGDGNTIKDHFAELQNITVNKNGYLYVYCSNQSPAKVFFDNLQVIHTKSPLVEETHYYPFGLTMARISSKAAGFLTNKYKFGAKELNSNEFSDGSGLELYDFAARNFDPQIGRWWSNDPKADKSVGISPYNYCFNNPIKFFDPDGKFPYTFIVRSYEHSNIFASPLTSLGDGRNATTSSDATARIHYRMNVETNGNKLENYRAWSSPTIQLVNPISPVSGPLVDLAHPKYNASSDGRGNYSFDAAAPNPVASKMVPILGKLMTPDIDIKGNMSITEKNGTLNIKGQINGDGFPDAETFIKDNSGQALMLGTYNHGEMASPFWSLEGDGNKKMIDVNMQVQLDKNGNFSKAWSIDSKGHKTRLSIVAPEKD